jgi:hypothetical protein
MNFKLPDEASLRELAQMMAAFAGAGKITASAPIK